MHRPEEFQQPHVALRNIPYLWADASTRDKLSEGGVLGSGRILWTQNACGSRTRSGDAIAFVDGIGTIFVDSRWLTKTKIVAGQAIPS